MMMTTRWTFIALFGGLVLLGSVRVTIAAPPAQAKAVDNYKTHCVVCHTPTGDSPIAMMNFVDGEWKNGSRIKDIVKVITDGVPSSAMMPFKDKMSEAEILDLAKYVRAFDKKLK